MRRLILICLLGLVSMGCKTDPHATREIALLRSEILDLENQYYALKSQYRFALKNSQECKDDSVGSDSLYGEQPTFYDNNMPYCEDPVLSYGNEVIINDGNHSPQYREPRLAPNREELPPPNNQQQNQDRPVEDIDINSQGTTWDSGNEIQLEGFEVTGQFRRASTVMEVASISISESATRGENLDGVAGDEGLVLLIQPQSDSGAVLQTTGDLTVSVIDPRETGNRQQIGLWQFSAAEVPNFFVRDELIQQGILLHLPWDAQIPRNENLVVNVQFADSTQQRHESSFEITIVPPPQDYIPDDSLIADWLENDSRWVDLATAQSSLPAVMAGSRNGPTAGQQQPTPMPVKSTGRSAPSWRPVR